MFRTNPSSYFRFKWIELQISLFFQPNSPFQAQKDVEDQIWKLRNMKGEPQLNKIWAQHGNLEPGTVV